MLLNVTHVTDVLTKIMLHMSGFQLLQRSEKMRKVNFLKFFKIPIYRKFTKFIAKQSFKRS